MGCTIHGKSYSYVSDYKDNDILRFGLNELTRKTYGFDFENWYQDGYWGNGYIPHSLLDGETLVSNVSVNIMDFHVLGKNKRYIQLGTVMTDEAYRNKGLSHFLIEKVIEEWESNCDLLYLFANGSVTKFYPKFGFIPMNEYQYSKPVTDTKSSFHATKLDMSVGENRQLVMEKAQNTIPLSKIAMQDNVSLIMFYLTSFMESNVYYIEELDAIIVAEYDENVLHIQDVFACKDVFEDAIHAMTTETIQKLVLGFAPESDSSYQVEQLREENTTLFVRGDDRNIFRDNKVMFPVLSHA